MGRLDGTVALVSGGAAGQGAAIARRFVAEGAAVTLGDVADEPVAAVAAELGDRARAVHLDVRLEADWQRAVDETLATFGRLTVLVNNAGVYRVAAMSEMPLDDYLEVVGVNQVGCWLGMKVASPAIAEAGGGAIVNTSSTAGLRGMAGRTAYVASKWAVRGMSKAAALELAPLGIRVNAVFPGVIDTEMAGELGRSKAAEQPIARPGSPGEVASLMVFLASAESAYCTGAEFVIDGGATAG